MITTIGVIAGVSAMVMAFSTGYICGENDYSAHPQSGDDTLPCLAVVMFILSMTLLIGAPLI